MRRWREKSLLVWNNRVDVNVKSSEGAGACVSCGLAVCHASPHPPALSSFSLFPPIFPVTADRVCMMKTWRSELQGDAKAKLFYPEQSEINPAEMEMRHNERMNSRSARGGRQKAEGRRRRRVGAVTNPKTCFNLLKLLHQQTGLNPVTPHTSSFSLLSSPRTTKGKC